jgi:AraC-like DNA-binding protein
MPINTIKVAWQETLRAGSVSGLFDNLPDTLFFAKDREKRLMAGNKLFVERCGYSDEAEMSGHDDYDIFPVDMAETFRATDELVIESGEPRVGVIEHFPNLLGDPEWFITDKIPLFSTTGECAGLCGIVRSYERSHAALQPYLDLLPAAEYLRGNLNEKVTIPELAHHVGMSTRNLQRRFIETFKVTPQHYLAKLRVLKGCELLVHTNQSITEIAVEVGFYDHSAFSNRFSEIVGVSPSAYRKRYLMTDAPLSSDERALTRFRAPRKLDRDSRKKKRRL